MRKTIGCVAAMMCAMGMAGEVVAAENNSSQAPFSYDFILKDCQETDSIGDPRSAMRAVDPAYLLKNYFEGGYDVDLAAVKTTLLKNATHGKITPVVDNTGRTWYRYDAEPNYVGNDQAVFMAEFHGKLYKIVVDLHVFMGVTPGDQAPYVSTCPPAKLIKVNGKPG